MDIFNSITYFSNIKTLLNVRTYRFEMNSGMLISELLGMDLKSTSDLTNFNEIKKTKKFKKTESSI